MHGMTNAEMRTFRAIKATAKTDVAAAKKMATAWFKAARTPTVRQRRMNMARAVKFLYSHY
jgi:hypothetical protein